MWSWWAVFGVTMLPSSVTSPSVGPEFDSGDTGAWVGDVPEPDVPEPDGVCGAGAGSVAPAAGGFVVHQRSSFSSGSCLALIEGEFVGPSDRRWDRGGDRPDSGDEVVRPLSDRTRNLGDGLDDFCRRCDQRKLDVDFGIQILAIGVAHVHEQPQHRLDGT